MAEGDDAKRIQEAARRAKQAEIAAAQARITKLLERARREVLADVADTEWERFFVPRLQAAIDRQLDQWRAAASEQVQKDMASAWVLGGDALLDTAAAINLTLALPEIPTSLLLAMQQKAGQRIGGLANFAKDQVDNQIAAILLAGKPREEAIAAIGRSLVSGTREGFRPEGLFGTVNARARFIAQHELGQVYSTAQDLRRDQVVRYAPELVKVWVHDGHPLKPRLDHVAMHGQRRAQDEDFRNPVTGEELAYPRDPSADISETAGCTCDVFLYREEYGTGKTPEEKVLSFIGPATGSVEKVA